MAVNPSHVIRASRIILLLVGLALAASATSIAALLDGRDAGGVLIGRDDDNTDNPAIQPPNVAANQSLNNADVLNGGGGHEILIGLRGSDVLLGGPERDILIGGPEQGTQPNSDIMLGGPGDDVSIWAPGDGSDAFIGGPGTDALVFASSIVTPTTYRHSQGRRPVFDTVYRRPM